MGRLFGGHCRLCDEDWKGQGITSHVKRCLAEHANQAAIHHGLLVGARANGHAGRYWLYFLVRPEAPLTELDDYLRGVWFEQNGHPSVFNIEGTPYLSTQSAEEDDEAPVESMEVDVGGVLRPRMDFGYQYNPQCPTEVELTVYDPFPCPAALVDEGSEGYAVTIARSEMGELECSTCGEPAVYFCASCAEAAIEAEKAAEEAAKAAEADQEADEEQTDEEDEEASFLGDPVTEEAEASPGPSFVGPYACEDCKARHDAELDPVVDSPKMDLC
jgi:hypothetical protein